MTHRFLKKLEWMIDYYLVYFLYNEKKRNRYHKYMKSKYKGYGEW